MLNVEGREAPYRRAVEVARAQAGVISFDQLRACGVGPSTVRDWVRSARLLRLHRGVYALGHDALRAEGRWRAAVLAAGEGSALSFAAAAASIELRPTTSRLVDVSIVAARRPQAGLRIHRPRSLVGDVFDHRGIPTTTPTRTLIDLALVLPLRSLERIAGEAEHRDLLDHARLARARSKKLKLIFGGDPRPAGRARSYHEDRLARAIVSAGLPAPERNAWLTHGGGEEWQPDLVFREARVLVEVDDDRHRTATAFELDRLKDTVRQADGWATPRVTHRQIREELPAVVARIGAIVAARLNEKGDYAPQR